MKKRMDQFDKDDKAPIMPFIFFILFMGLMLALLFLNSGSSFMTAGRIIYSEEFKSEFGNPQACIFPDSCPPGLTCRYADDKITERLCLPPLAQGKKCRGKYDCQQRMICVIPNAGASITTCQKTPRLEGQTCLKREDCTIGYGCIVTEGKNGFTCQPVPRNQAQRCSLPEDCRNELRCIKNVVKYSGIVGTCQPPLKKGQKCFFENDCESGLYCREARQGGSICMTGDEFKKMWRT